MMDSDPIVFSTRRRCQLLEVRLFEISTKQTGAAANRTNFVKIDEGYQIFIEEEETGYKTQSGRRTDAHTRKHTPAKK
jgi:hypothetical protein